MMSQVLHSFSSCLAFNCCVYQLVLTWIQQVCITASGTDESFLVVPARSLKKIPAVFCQPPLPQKWLFNIRTALIKRLFSTFQVEGSKSTLQITTHIITEMHPSRKSADNSLHTFQKEWTVASCSARKRSRGLNDLSQTGIGFGAGF